MLPTSFASSLWPLFAAAIIFGGTFGAKLSPAAPSSTPAKPRGTMPRESPVINLAPEFREWNWGGGSCVHASTVMVLRWSNNLELAAWWRKTYAGGESYNGLTSKLTRNKVPWYSSYSDNAHVPPHDVAAVRREAVAAADEFSAIIRRLGGSTYGTASGDAKVLDRCIQERRGAVIFYYPNHSIMLNHMDEQFAYVLDNNRINEFIRIPRETFIRNWQSYGGVAVVPVIGAPRPPKPWL